MVAAVMPFFALPFPVTRTQLPTTIALADLSWFFWYLVVSDTVTVASA
jgi:hypothetical protein